MDRFAPYRAQLDALETAGRKRRLSVPAGRDFSSNDYLGLSRSPYLRQVAQNAIADGIAHGSGGSRLLGGNHPEHEALESFAASHYGAESSLFFGSGFAANVALFATLPQTGDLVLYDEYVHASVHDGMKLGRAEYRSFRHNDCDAVEREIRAWRAAGGRGTAWIAAESLYSMDGDRAPLAELARTADIHDAILVIDEAHAVGVYGKGGIGLSGDLGHRENVIILRTFGKALGGEGGLLTMATILREFFINRARPFIFSTAPSPLTAHLAHHAIAHVADNPSLQAGLASHIALARDCFAGLSLGDHQDSQIFPVIIGEDRVAVDVAARLQRQGFDVRAIRPPTVPAGTARLRISLTLNVTEADIRSLATALHDALAMEKAA
ncbi:8-amino-7-oxononanoate synthase [Parasphingorhabdus flavimaris]|uniref:8-amino-7-oxononanoate synthase n=1 Tax=Parasphingorhabdus flavimaris TaxID=266812 RepID=A0ABX2N5L4_9SPHN|nr:8-amino-7-oxononanoate synthase [Parasphingorhabdus flavimaris]NVD28888.1 8-amino-7-oxononanoate synthase [Parasphingorhabdus flavimaris]|tara:strand:- start:1153 stop:2295 length:1143 start_codon:yes stop_codon:yes gene_type:complete